MTLFRPMLAGLARSFANKPVLLSNTNQRCFCIQQSCHLQQQSSLSDHEKRLQEFFRAYDLNGDGEITREELFRALKRAIGYNDVATESIVQAVYDDCGKKTTEKITFTDFKNGIKVIY